MPKDDIDLIRQYAPILWLDENEAFLPEDVQIMERIARVGRSNRSMRPVRMDRLGNLQNSEQCYMDIPGVNFASFGLGPGYTGQEVGPAGVSAYMKMKYGNNPFLDPSARKVSPSYYARVSEVHIFQKPDEPFSVYFNKHDPGVFGRYQVIQYYFFYLFNDAWNKHIGDWDSTLELFIKDDNSRGYGILHMHHLTWMVSFSAKYRKLNRWIDEWRRVERQKRMGPLFHLAVHPFVFIARGAHGGYPTPGFSIHGITVAGQNVIGQADYRQIGKLCILPEYPPITRSWILDTLKEAGIGTSKTRFLPWGEPVVLTDQAWLQYRGMWGSRSKYRGWSGPTGPAQKGYWRMDQRRFKNTLIEAIRGNYKGGWVLRVFENWHGWLGIS